MSDQAKWVLVSSVDEVPEDGAGHAVKIQGLEIALFNSDQGFFALENFCPHLGFPLTEGIVQEGVVICGWHGWRVRLEDGGCHGKTSVAKVYPCEVRGTDIYIQIPEISSS